MAELSDGVVRPDADQGGAAEGGAAEGGAERAGAARSGDAEGGAARSGDAEGGAARGGTERPGAERPGAERGGADGAAVVRAAGGVVWRPATGGREICLVHRARYDDWSLPKGKLDPGEHPLAAAVREVAEETGLAAVPQLRLPTIGYRLGDGARKTVDYWVMRARAVEPFVPNDEVDEVRWLPPEGAAELLSYGHDAELARQAASLPPVTAVVVLLRHAYAGERKRWSGPDELRPLDATGRATAAALAGLLPVVAPARLVTATPDRCRQTLEPLARRLDLPIATDPAYDERADTEAAVAALRDLAAALADAGPAADRDAAAADAAAEDTAAGGRAAVVCSQGKLIPRALAALLGGEAERYRTRKGDSWLLAFVGRDCVAADPIPAP